MASFTVEVEIHGTKCPQNPGRIGQNSAKSGADSGVGTYSSSGSSDFQNLADQILSDSAHGDFELGDEEADFFTPKESFGHFERKTGSKLKNKRDWRSKRRHSEDHKVGIITEQQLCSTPKAPM